LGMCSLCNIRDVGGQGERQSVVRDSRTAGDRAARRRMRREDKEAAAEG